MTLMQLCTTLQHIPRNVRVLYVRQMHTSCSTENTGRSRRTYGSEAAGTAVRGRARARPVLASRHACMMHLVNRWGCKLAERERVCEFAVAGRGLRGEKRNCRQMTMSGRVLRAYLQSPPDKRSSRGSSSSSSSPPEPRFLALSPSLPREGILNQQATHTTTPQHLCY